MTNYERIILRVADEYKTTPEEVENEMNKALIAAGLNITPELFIAICSSKTKNMLK